MIHRTDIGETVPPSSDPSSSIAAPVSSLQAATRLLAEHRLDDAERAFRNALAGGAEEVASHAGLAEVARRRGDLPAAIEILTAVSRRHPSTTRLAVQLADDLRALGRHQEAEAQIGALLERGVDSEQLRLVAGRLAEARGDVDSAIEDYQRATGLRPERAPAFLRLGCLLLAKGRLAEAEPALRRAIALVPHEGKAYAALAELMRRRGDRAEAVNLLGKAVECLPQNTKLRLRLVGELFKSGDHSQARECLRHLPEQARRGEAALLLEARIAEAQGDFTAAAAAYDAVKSAAPDSAGGALAHALALWRSGRCAEAEAGIRSLRDKRPHDVQVLLALARIVSETDRVGEAADIVDEILRLDPRRSDAWILRSAIVGRLSSVRESAAVLQAARDVISDDVPLLLADCHLQFDRGLDDAGERRLAQAERLRPQDFSVRKLRAVRLIAVGPCEEVRAALGRLPRDTVAQRAEHDLLVGKFEASRLRFQEAEASLQAVVTAYPRHAGAMHLLARTQLATLQVFEARQSLARLNHINRGQLAAKNRSMNVSQGLIGEILNDCWSDASALTATRAAVRRGELSEVIAVVRENPHYTGAAIALMNTLRRTGALDDGAGTTLPPGDEARCPFGDAEIPRRIHQFWDATDPPEDVSELMDSWRERNPGWSYRRFDTASARAYLSEHLPVEVQRAFRSAHHVAQKSDVFRLAVLACEGGVYADADDRCMGSLDALVADRELVLRQEHLGSIGNNFIAVRPGHPLVVAALTAAVTAVLRGDSESMWLSTGPGLLTRTYAGHLSEEGARLSGLHRGARILLDWQLKPFCTSGCRASYKSSPRHWVVREFANAR